MVSDRENQEFVWSFDDDHTIRKAPQYQALDPKFSRLAAYRYQRNNILFDYIDCSIQGEFEI